MGEHLEVHMNIELTMCLAITRFKNQCAFWPLRRSHGPAAARTQLAPVTSVF